MSGSVRPHRRQPTRLPCPWDSPGKNTGVDCHFLLQCRKVKSEREVAQSCPALRDPMDCSPPGFSIHGIFQARVLEWGAIAFSSYLAFDLKNRMTSRPQFLQHLPWPCRLGCLAFCMWGLWAHQQACELPVALCVVVHLSGMKVLLSPNSQRGSRMQHHQ